MKKINVTFLWGEEYSFATDMTSGHVEYLGEELVGNNSLVELLVDKDKLHEVKVEWPVSGSYHTWHIETVKPYKDGHETKYAVMTWERE